MKNDITRSRGMVEPLACQPDKSGEVNLLAVSDKGSKLYFC